MSTTGAAKFSAKCKDHVDGRVLTLPTARACRDMEWLWDGLSLQALCIYRNVATCLQEGMLYAVDSVASCW